MIKDKDYQESLNYKEDEQRLIEQKKFLEAVDIYNTEILKIKDKKELSILYFKRADCNYSLGRTIFSLSDAWRCVQLDPSNVSAILLMAKCCNECGNYKLECKCYMDMFMKTLDPSYLRRVTETNEIKSKAEKELKSFTFKNMHGNTFDVTKPLFFFPTIKLDNTKVSDDPEFFKNLTRNNPLIEIVDIDGYGRGVVAKKNIKKGSIIIYEEAVMTATARSDLCGNCLKKPIKPLYSEFKEECYCSKDCQNKAWESYFKYLNGRNLNKFREILHDSSSDGNKTYMFIIKLFASIQLKEEGSNNMKLIPLLKHLYSSYYEGNWSGNVWEVFLEFKDLLKLQDNEAFDFQFVYEAYTRLSCNVCAIHSAGCDHLTNASGLFPTYSFINHDCTPNATWSADLKSLGNVIEVKALRDISKGEQIFITYIGEIDRERRKNRLSQYGISCKCKKCI